MFDPISARFASSFSRNGIRLAATETSCFGLTSMYSISSRCFRTKLPACRALTRSSMMLAVFVEADVRLSDDVLVFFPGREIIAVGFEFGRLLLAARAFVGLVDFAAQHDLRHLEFGFAGIQDPDFVHHLAVFDAAIRALDEPVIVDPRKAGQRRISPMFGPSGVSIGQIRP